MRDQKTMIIEQLIRMTSITMKNDSRVDVVLTLSAMDIKLSIEYGFHFLVNGSCSLLRFTKNRWTKIILKQSCVPL